MIADIYNKNKNETMLQMKIIICDVIVIFTCWWDVMRILLMRIMLEIPDHYRDTFRLSKSYSQTRIWRLQQNAYSIIYYHSIHIFAFVFWIVSSLCQLVSNVDPFMMNRDMLSTQQDSSISWKSIFCFKRLLIKTKLNEWSIFIKNKDKITKHLTCYLRINYF